MNIDIINKYIQESVGYHHSISLIKEDVKGRRRGEGEGQPMMKKANLHSL
jgi:hypothetical protein